MFYDYRSQSLTQLSDKFLELLSKNIPEDPFKKNWIVVQNREMQQWLTFQEADTNSISANNEFIFPSEFLWKLYRLKNPDLPKHLSSDKLPVQWSVFDILNTDEDLLFEITGKRSSDQKHLLQLSQAISDVFDLYQVFRPELIDKWEKNQLKYNSNHEKWQSKLWRILVQKWSSNPEFVSRVDAFKDLGNWIKTESFPFEIIPENIWVFSLPHFSAPFSDILSLLSKRLHIHNFGYSFEKVETGSESISFSSKLLKSHFDNYKVLVQSLEAASLQPQIISLAAKSASTAKLSGIQDVLKDERTAGLVETDGSFSIHSCHSIKREAEVLKDTLLNAFNEYKDLKPEECMILVPNLNDYRTILKDVLSEEINESNIPIGKGFEDTTSLRNNTLFELLSVLSSDFKVNPVLELIDNPIISERWRFTESELNTLREWAVELHIHRGLDDSVFSWKSGLDRLFLGYAMEGDKYKLFENKAVYTKNFNSDSTSLLAKLSAFIELLEKKSDQLKATLSVTEWIRRIINIADSLLLMQYDESFKINTLINELEELAKKVEPSESEETIEFGLFLIWLKKQISLSGSVNSWFGHGINISEYVPNRNIPFKFVAILGLSENVLPSPVIRPEFDLIHQNPAPGDRIEKFEQRYLFFDMINAAQQQLHISFLGQNSQSHIDTSPSVLVQEMIDVCKQQNISIDIKKHRLHGFEKEYFRKDQEDAFSYSERRKVIANYIDETEIKDSFLLNDEASLVSEDEFFEIHLSDLVSFFTHPVKYICRNELDISNFEDLQDPEDRELFDTKELDRYFLKDFLQEAFFENLDPGIMKSAAKASGLVPEDFPGEIDFQSNMNLIRKLNVVREEYDLSAKKRVEVDVSVGPYRVHGTVSNIIEGDRLEIRLGRLKGKNILDMWLNHQVLNVESDYKSRLFYFDTKDNLKNLSLTSEMAQDGDEIKRLLNFYVELLKNPSKSVFPLESGYEYAKALFETESEEKAMQAASGKWDSWGGFSESDDYYNGLVHKTADFINEIDFQKTAKELWFPIFKSIGDLE